MSSLTNENVIDQLMELDDHELVEVLEHVLDRRAIGFQETFSALAPHERLLARLRATLSNWRLGMEAKP